MSVLHSGIFVGEPRMVYAKMALALCLVFALGLAFAYLVR